MAPITLKASEGMDHASYINKLALGNGDKFADALEWVSNLRKRPARVRLYH